MQALTDEWWLAGQANQQQTNHDSEQAAAAMSPPQFYTKDQMNIILTSARTESPIDDKHQFVTIGQNCWGVGKTASEAHRNAKANAHHNKRNALYITRVVTKDGFNIDPVDGAVGWSANHNAAECPYCTVGKGIRINTDKTFKE